MPIIDLYSSRKARAEKTEDVWQYDHASSALRVQVSNIVKGALGPVQEYGKSSVEIYTFLCNAVSHEHGRGHLSKGSGTRSHAGVHTCIRTEPDLLVWLDLVELAFRSIENTFGHLDEHGRDMRDITISAKDAVNELNERFRRAGFGYRYEQGKILRLDNEFLHQEATVPALRLLSDPKFAGADEEFRAAHDHLKAGEFKDCTVDALNALESTMKAICDAKGWKYEKGGRASDLVKVLRSNNLFPEVADQSIDQLLATLKSGLPVVRNKTGATGRALSRSTRPSTLPFML